MRSKQQRRPEDSSGKLHRKAVLIQCIDCKVIMGTEKGRSPEVEVSWSLCARCVARRNGMAVAKSPNDIGIY